AIDARTARPTGRRRRPGRPAFIMRTVKPSSARDRVPPEAAPAESVSLSAALPGRAPYDRAPYDRAPFDLALFDLDYTLLPIDSDYEWARFLIRLGVVDGTEYDRRNDVFFAQYHAGTLDIDEFLAFQLAPLAAHPVETLDAWRARFVDEVIR